MKKYLFIATVAVVAMAACTKVEIDENVPGKKISFEVASYTPQITKANTALEDESFQSFYTYANLFQSYSDPAVYMNNVQIIFDDSGAKNVWAPARDYYWPKSTSSYINFYSYVNTKPTGAGNLNPAITFNPGKTQATVTYTDKVIESTDNILLADPALHQNGNLTTYTGISNVTSGVPTLFRHLLAKVNFTVKLETEEEKKSTDTRFVVTILNADSNVSTLVAHKQGSFTATHTDTAESASIGTWIMPTVWTPAAGPVTETISMLTPTLTLAKNATSSGNAVALLNERTVMPQTLSATNQFNLAFQIDTYYDNEESPYMTEVLRFSGAISTLVNTITAWNKNTKITYNIIIDPISQKVTFDPAVEEWSTANGTYNYPAAS